MKYKLKKIASIQMGYSFRAKIETSLNGNISVIQMKDLKSDNTVDCSNLDMIEMEGLKEHHFIQKGDLVFRSRGLDVTSAIILDSIDNAVISAPLLRIRINKPDLIIPEYLNWYISQREAQTYLRGKAEGTLLKMIAKQTLENMEIVIPSLQKQRFIVDMASLSSKESNILKQLSEKRAKYISVLLMNLSKGEKQK